MQKADIVFELVEDDAALAVTPVAFIRDADAHDLRAAHPERLKDELCLFRAAQGRTPRVAHFADDGDHARGGHMMGLCDQRGKELRLPVAAPEVVIQLAAAGVAERLRADGVIKRLTLFL